MQAKRRYESVFEVDPCGNCGTFARLDKNGHCAECQDDITEWYDEDGYIRQLARQCWRGAAREAQARGRG